MIMSCSPRFQRTAGRDLKQQYVANMHGLTFYLSTVGDVINAAQRNADAPSQNGPGPPWHAPPPRAHGPTPPAQLATPLSGPNYTPSHPTHYEPTLPGRKKPERGRVS
jgi:hypothetical protein